MDQQTLLYLFSTLAQTCAALAAFVGAVGVFRLQTLREQRREAERETRVRSEGLHNRDTLVIPLTEVRAAIERQKGKHPNAPRAASALADYDAFPSHISNSRYALIAFEVWNLILIGASLVAFNYISALACAPVAAAVGLWSIAVGTVLLTLWCVVVWTRAVAEPAVKEPAETSAAPQ